jgi:RecB family exonuclease
MRALGRLRGAYPADTVASFRGSLAHRIFARHLVSGPIPDGDVSQACREEIGAPDGHLNRKLAPLELNRPSRLAPVIAEVGDLYARFKRFPADGFRSAEVNLEADVGGGVLLRGRVDAVFENESGAPSIIDWKTGSWLEDAEPQLSFYALVWALERGTLPARAEAVSVQTGERTGIDPTVDQADRTAREIAEMVDTLRAAFATGEDLERRAGPHCRWCPLLGECAEGAAAIEILGS